MTQLQAWLASSQDPTKVSATVSGLVIGASSFIIAFAMNLFHLQISASDVSSLATGIGMTAGAIVFLYGLARKFLVHVGKA